MRILLDLICLQTGSRNRGIGRYSLNLTKSLCESYANEEILILTKDSPGGSLKKIIEELHPHPKQNFKPLHLPDLEYENLDNDGTSISTRLQQISLDACYERLRPDIRHTNSHFEWDIDYPPPIKRNGISSVILYDIIPFIFKEKYITSERESIAYQKKIEQLKNYDLVFSISDATKRDAINLLGLNPERIINISGACDKIFTPSNGKPPNLIQRHGISKRYIYYTGNIDHRKNCESLMHAYSQIDSRLRVTHQLVITAPLYSGTKDIFLKILNKYRLTTEEVIFTGSVSDQELIELYQNCTAFIFPSLYEGFGLPVLEAMACGAPTIAANNSSIPEILDRPDALFSALNVNEITKFIERVLSDKDFRQSLHESGLATARKFSWARTAQICYESWKSAVDKKNAYPMHSMKSTMLRPKPLTSNALSSINILDLISQSLASEGIEIAKLSSDQLVFKNRGLPRESYGNLVIFNHTDEERQAKILSLARNEPTTVLFTNETGSLNTNDLAPSYLDFAEAIVDNAVGVILEQELDSQSHLRQILNRFKVPERSLRKNHLSEIIDFIVSGPTEINYKPATTLPTIAPQIHSFNRIRDWLSRGVELEPSMRAPRMYIDVTGLLDRWTSGYVTGIERVSWKIIESISGAHSTRLWFVSLSERNLRDYFIVRKIQDRFHSKTSTIAKFQPGDRLVIPNVRDNLSRGIPAWSQLMKQGVNIHVILYDLLATRYPQFFPEGDNNAQRDYLDGISTYADSIHAISKTVADDYIEWISENRNTIKRSTKLDIHHFPLGCDFINETQTPPRQNPANRPLRNRPTFISVGTIEPRKGYDFAISTFDHLWAINVDVDYVIVGRKGWMTETTIRRIVNHKEYGGRLIWDQCASDEELRLHYQNATALIAMSTAEGYGLPLVEAANFGTPIIAADIPVFREICKAGAMYFDLTSPTSLVECVMRFMQFSLVQKNDMRKGMIKYTWAQSAEFFLRSTLDSSPYRTLAFNSNHV